MRLPIAFLLAVSASSCLISDDDGDGTNYVPVNEISQAYKDAQCEHLAMCGIFPTRETCLAAELGATGQFDVDPNVVAAIYGGHIVYDGSAVKACIDSIATRSCDSTEQSARRISPDCARFFRGTLMAGEGCYIDEECISQRCSGESGGTCSQGNCIGDTPPNVVPAQIGDNCSSSFAGCAGGAYCDQLTNLCTALKGSGVTCTLDSECAYGLGCEGTTGSRTCAARPTIGQACSVDGFCRDEGTYCDFTTDMCRQLGLPNAQCTSSSQCSRYYPCDLSTSPGVCRQGAGLGDMCSGSNICFDVGTFCDFTGGICTSVKADGSPCNNSQECASGSCDFNTQLCASPMTCF